MSLNCLGRPPRQLGNLSDDGRPGRPLRCRAVRKDCRSRAARHGGALKPATVTRYNVASAISVRSVIHPFRPIHEQPMNTHFICSPRATGMSVLTCLTMTPAYPAAAFHVGQSEKTVEVGPLDRGGRATARFCYVWPPTPRLQPQVPRANRFLGRPPSMSGSLKRRSK